MHRRPRPPRSRLRGSVAVGIVAGVVLASSAPAAVFAAPGDRSEAEALLLSGGGLINLDTLVELAGPYNAYTPGDEVGAPLDVGALGLIDLGPVSYTHLTLPTILRV